MSQTLTAHAEKPPRPPATRAAAKSAETSGAVRVPRLVELAARELSLQEVKFAEVFAQMRNAAEAYRQSHDCSDMTYEAVRQAGVRISHLPHVARYINELLGDAARASSVEIAALLETDRAIVRAYEQHAADISQYVIEPCRHCNGIDHAYQWIDLDEFLAALDTAEADNDVRREKQQRIKPLPDDRGGYGFTVNAEPSATCPRCEGHGRPTPRFADTRKLKGDAALIVRGVKVTANGIEILMHDYDKAKERLYKAAGAFGDDAASVARGAAAGAAMGSAAASALAKRIESMSEDEARKAYLATVSGAS